MRTRALLAIGGMTVAGFGLIPATAAPGDAVVGLFTGERVDEAATLLQRAGLLTHRFDSFDVVVARGTAAELDAVSRTTSAPWFRNDPLVQHSAATNAQIGAAALHVKGVDGRGVQIAVVDSGVDASIPDLRKRVTRNFKVVADEKSGQGTIVDAGEGSNTDGGGGHGTAVTSVIAADGKSRPDLTGVAPGADIIGYGAGVTLVVLDVLLAYDHMLDPDLGVDVVNNSFGAQVWAPFQADLPINVATKALSDAGIAVVFAAGNRGEVMTLNPYALPPWVISAGSSTPARLRAAHSSQGIPYDGATASAFVDGRASFTGDRPGLYRPTVLAPGEAVVAHCTAAGTVTGPCAGESEVSGTSFAAPHLSGVLALLRQVRPTLKPADAKRVLEVTARPIPAAVHTAVGYGEVDATAAITLTRRRDFKTALAAAGRRADARILGVRPWSVVATEHVNLITKEASAGGTESHDVQLNIPAGTEGLSVSIAYPNASSYAGLSTSKWEANVYDAAGRHVAAVLPQKGGQGVLHVLADLRGRKLAWGRWTFRLSSTVNSGDDVVVRGLIDDQLKKHLMLAVSRLRARITPLQRGAIAATGSLTLPLRRDPTRPTAAAPSPEGCSTDPATPLAGALGGPASAMCVSAPFGGSTTTAAGTTPAPRSAVFTSAPLTRATLLGGTGRLIVDLSDQVAFPANPPRVLCTWSVLGAGGTTLVALPEIVCAEETAHGRTDRSFAMPALKVPAGAALRVSMRRAGAHSTAGRILFDGPDHGDTGFVLQTGRVV